MCGAGIPTALVQETASADGDDHRMDTEFATHLSSASAISVQVSKQPLLTVAHTIPLWQLPATSDLGMKGAHSQDHAGAGTSMAARGQGSIATAAPPCMSDHINFVHAGVPAAVIMQEQAEADDDDLIVATEGAAPAAAGARGRGGAPGEQGALVRNILEVEQALQVSPSADFLCSSKRCRWAPSAGLAVQL